MLKVHKNEPDVIKNEAPTLSITKTMANKHDNDASTNNVKKLRPLVITMGPPRQEYIRQLFSHSDMECYFDPPVFVDGVPSRALRNRNEFFRYANEAGLLPKLEWKALASAAENPDYASRPDTFFECLNDVLPERQGKVDENVHYSIELWRKAKTLTRERAVLACFLAHLIAMKRLTAEGFDFILEDNVRAPTSECGRRIIESITASMERQQHPNCTCHLRFYGWLGSTTNLKWIYDKHINRASYKRSLPPTNSPLDTDIPCTVFTFPMPSDFERDIQEDEEVQSLEQDSASSGNIVKRHSKPGGNPIWGAYAYWISPQGFHEMMHVLRNDVGAILWKGKRQRNYKVKPIDKVLPRRIMSSFGLDSLHLATHPAFFRAPMLTSKIHAKWDAEFCKSTNLQLARTDLVWNDLWLTPLEQTVVAYHEMHGVWLTSSDVVKEENDYPE